MPYTYAGEFADAVLNTSGRPLKSTSITVKKADGAVASLYTDRTKAHAAPNPLPTDSYGNLVFFADPDAYRLFAAGGPLGGTVVVVHPDPAEPAGGGANFWPVLSEANMLALPAKKGDIAIRTDLHRNFGLQGDDPSVLGDWEELEASLSTGLLHESILVGKGDLITASGAATPQRLAVGADGLPLVADSADALGVKYEQLHTGALADGAVTAAKVAADVATQAELDAEAAARAAADLLLVPLTQKGAASGVATLDSGGKVPSAQLPAIAISDFLGTVVSQAAMLALSGQRGDWAIRSDTSTSWVLIGDDATQLANWKQLATPPDAVLSVQGLTGVVVLPADDVPSVASLRTLGTGAQQATPGTHPASSDHPNLGNGTPTSSTPGDSGTAGVGGTTARADHRHGRADSYAAANPQALGAAAPGTAATVSRGDHVHPTTGMALSTDVTAEAAARVAGDTTRQANTQTANYTLVLADAGLVVEVNAATGKTVTIPTDASVAFPTGSIVWVQQIGAGAATVAGAGGVTVEGATVVTSGVGSGLLLRKRAANDWVVQATSSATSSASWEVIAEAVVSSAVATIDFTSIPATYRHLRLVGSPLKGDTGAAQQATLWMRINNDSGTNYLNAEIKNNSGTLSASGTNDAQALAGYIVDAGAQRATEVGYADITVFNYRETSFGKRYSSRGGAFYNAGNGVLMGVDEGIWLSTAAINRLTLLIASGVNFTPGCYVTLYGMKGLT